MDKFTQAYIQLALASSKDDKSSRLADNYDVHDFDDKTLSQMMKDCKDFQEAHGHFYDDSDDDHVTVAGYGFWLIRNSLLGAGSYSEGFKILARRYGKFNLFITDDGKISSR